MEEALPGVEWLSREAAREAAAAAAAEGDRLSSGEATTSVGVFELLDRDLLESATCARNAPRPPPLNQEEWLSFLNTEGEQGFSHSLLALFRPPSSKEAVLSLRHLLHCKCVVEYLQQEVRTVWAASSPIKEVMAALCLPQAGRMQVQDAFVTILHVAWL
jgi:hypothetical protein